MFELYLEAPNNLTIQDVQARETSLKDDDVRISMIYGGICGSDLSVYKGKIPYAVYPVRPGHELLGVVVEAGSSALQLVGQRVVVVPNTFCGECTFCRDGQRNLCTRKKSMGVNVNGGFSEEIIVSSKFVLPVPDDITDKRAVLTEPLAVVIHAFKKAKINQYTSVAIMGCGNEGMFAIALASSIGAHTTAIDIKSDKLEKAKHLGAKQVRHPQDLEHEGFDVVIEAAGTSESVEQAIRLVRPGGVCVLIGITESATLPVAQVVRREISLLGSIIYDFPNDFLLAMEYLREESFAADLIISKIIPVSHFNTAYKEALTGSLGKILLDFKSFGIE